MAKGVWAMWENMSTVFQTQTTAIHYNCNSGGICAVRRPLFNAAKSETFADRLRGLTLRVARGVGFFKLSLV
jgi:hypothetical protein